MILFDRESVKGRSGTFHGFASELISIQTTSHSRLDAMNRKKTAKIGRKSILCSEQNV